MEESNTEKPMICVLCGHPWGVENPFTNRCENTNCNGFCTWGHELGKPLSFTVDENNNWIPNAPPPDDFGLDELKEDPTPKTMDNIRQEIRDGSYQIAKVRFDFDTIFNFCQEHRVEVLLQDDTMYHCYIDYHLDTPKSKSSWATEFDGFTAMVRGISDYILHESTKA